nr:alpha rep [Croton yellow vein mosaic alphasatellite]
MSRVRNWCFTIFNYVLPLFTTLPDWANYIVFQEQACPNTKRKHIQGYVNLKTPQRHALPKKKLPDGSHIEPCRGSGSSNRDYCRKGSSGSSVPSLLGVFCETGSNKRKTMERFQEDPEELRLADPKLNPCRLATKVNTEFGGLVLPVPDRPWQLVAPNPLEMVPDDRTIIWVYGSEKIKNLPTLEKRRNQDGWFFKRGGKGENIKYQYAEHLGHCVFDKRGKGWGKIPYTVLEEIKILGIRSSPYEPIDFNCSDKVYVVVLSNFLPCLDLEYNNRGEVLKKPLLSRDRVFLINIDESVCGHPDDFKRFDIYLE